MIAQHDPRDARDLEVLGLRQAGASLPDISRAMRLPADIVENILASDRAEFPDEPLRGRA